MRSAMGGLYREASDCQTRAACKAAISHKWILVDIGLIVGYIAGMKRTLEQIVDDAMQLPPAARAEIADKLVESLAGADGDEIFRAWTAEAVARRDQLRSGAVAAIDGETVLAEVRRAVGR